MFRNWIKGVGIIAILAFLVRIISQQKETVTYSPSNGINSSAVFFATAGLVSLVWLVRREKTKPQQELRHKQKTKKAKQK